MEPKPEKQTRLSELIRLAGPQKGKLILSGALAVIGEGCGLIPFFVIYCIVAEVGSKSLNQIEPGLIRTLVFAGIAAIILKHPAWACPLLCRIYRHLIFSMTSGSGFPKSWAHSLLGISIKKIPEKSKR